MPHGAADFYQYRTGAFTHPVQDLAELVSRLHGIQSVDRRGDVLWWTDFSEGDATWGHTVNTDTGTAGVSAVQSRTAGLALLHDLGEVSEETIQSRCYISEAMSGRIGCEVAVSAENTNTIWDVVLAVRQATGYWLAGLRYNGSTNTLLYQDANASWSTLATGLDFLSVAKAFHMFKFVFDLDTTRYVRAIVDRNSYDMAGLIPYFAAGSYSTFSYVELTSFGNAAAVIEAYYDTVIITENEP